MRDADEVLLDLFAPLLRVSQSMDMRSWVKKFYKDASQWNDAIGQELKKERSEFI